MNDSINKKDLEEVLNISVKNGTILAKCPSCSEYLSYNEFVLLCCGKCKNIDFKNISYYSGPKKDNN